MTSGIELVLSDNRGIYIPRDFATLTDDMDNVTQKDRDILIAGPDHEQYWDTWSEVLDKASVVINGNTWRLYQDGDLWAYCEELMTDEEYRNFFGEPRERDNDLDADSRFETDNWYDTSTELK